MMRSILLSNLFLCLLAPLFCQSVYAADSCHALFVEPSRPYDLSNIPSENLDLRLNLFGRWKKGIPIGAKEVNRPNPVADVNLYNAMAKTGRETGFWTAFDQAGNAIAYGDFLYGSADEISGIPIRDTFNAMIKKIFEQEISANVSVIAFTHTHPNNAYSHYFSGQDIRADRKWREWMNSQTYFKNIVLESHLIFSEFDSNGASSMKKIGYEVP